MRARRWRALAVASLLTAGSLSSASHALAATPCDEYICPDPVETRDAAFVGTIMYATPGGRAQRVGGGGADCEGCVWHAVPSCAGNNVLWEPATGRIIAIDNLCTESGCAVRGERGTNLWFFVMRPGSMQFEQVDEVCVTPTTRPIVTGQQIADEVARYVRELPVPTPAFQIQPAQIRVVHKDVIFLIRPDRHRPVEGHEFSAFGITITLDAKPTYVWDFDTARDDGRTLETDSPGHRWPDQDVTTRYERTGEYGVQVAARWTGTYTISGIDGEYTVAGPEVASAVVPVPVREARAVLYDD